MTVISIIEGWFTFLLMIGTACMLIFAMLLCFWEIFTDKDIDKYFR